MPINNIPFREVEHNNSTFFYPYLPISIINPRKKENHVNTYGLIDTGADVCTLPISVAKALGVNLDKLETATTRTASGKAKIYKYKCIFEIYHPSIKKLVYTTEETPINFMTKLPMVLLGVDSFLSDFVLKINYPKKIFSINHP